MHRELDEDEEMVSPLQAGMLLVDWTDPQKSMYVRAVSHVDSGLTSFYYCREVHGRQTDQHVHFDLAIETMRALLGKDFDSESKHRPLSYWTYLTCDQT